MRLVRLFACVALSWAGITAGASAGEEVKCAQQYSLEEQLILEWAALGGDPHAQYAIAQCAFPDGIGELTEAERLYALKWSILATCDAADTEVTAERDRLTRKLKENADLSFRRFGGLTEEEKLNRREKRFLEFRDYRYEKLDQRYETLQSRVSDADRAKAREALADQFSRLGPLGLLRLSELSSCKNFGAAPSFSAAAWAATAEAWNASGASQIYGHSVEKDWSIAAERDKRMKGLSAKERRAAEVEKAALLKTAPATLARLEEQAALGRLENMAFLHAQAADAEAPRRSVTTAIQYALEALGFVEFVNGPDNDYGPSTIEGAKKAQAHYGDEPTRWLSHEEIRTIVCDAATLKSDPISYFHLGLMYSQGWGFPQDLTRARFALDQARSIIEARLADADDLPAWKQTEYPKFRTQIENAQASLDAASLGVPDHVRGEARPVTEASLCK
ncbi:MAG: hypothetical protein VX640_15365 [Pseudomonadota bacterium]|nr:hypothetical protein [Pseudomonadota bacterium]